MRASLNFLHHQANDWLRELTFYKEEIAILTKRLEEVAGKNTAQDVLAQVEHFQNKFIMLREQTDILKHDVNEWSQHVNELAKTKPEHIEAKISSTNDSLMSRAADLSKSISSTRFEFNQFLAKTL